MDLIHKKQSQNNKTHPQSIPISSLESFLPHEEKKTLERKLETSKLLEGKNINCQNQKEKACSVKMSYKIIDVSLASSLSRRLRNERMKSFSLKF